MDNILTSSEALFGFCAWLTTRNEAVTMSAHHNAGVAADLIKEFCRVNTLPEPRDNWTDYYTPPPSCDNCNNSYCGGNDLCEEGTQDHWKP